MAYTINEECISCDACISECPNNAIYGASEEWAYSDGTELSGTITLPSGEEVDADEMNKARSLFSTFIVAEKCTECQGFHDEPQCVEACAVGAAVQNTAESEEDLLNRKAWLHAE